MTDHATVLRQQLIRNVDEVKLERQQRAPLYDTRCGGITDGLVAKKLGAGFDILAPGKRSCPYHYHLAQEEMFVILAGLRARCAWPARCCRCARAMWW